MNNDSRPASGIQIVHITAIAQRIADEISPVRKVEPSLSKVYKVVVERGTDGVDRKQSAMLHEGDWLLLEKIWSESGLVFSFGVSPSEWQKLKTAFNASVSKPEWEISAYFQHIHEMSRAENSREYYSQLSDIGAAAQSGEIRLLTRMRDSVSRQDAEKYLARYGLELDAMEKSPSEEEETPEQREARLWARFNELGGSSARGSLAQLTREESERRGVPITRQTIKAILDRAEGKERAEKKRVNDMRRFTCMDLK